MSFQSALDFIVDGENLDEVVLNRNYRQLISRYDLFERIEDESTLNMDFTDETFKVYQVEGKTRLPFEDLVDFNRASTATYYDSPDGILKTAEVDEPRFVYNLETDEFDGLLVEEERTNLLKWTEDLRSPYTIWSTAVDFYIDNNATEAPDKTYSGVRLQFPGTGISSFFGMHQPTPSGDISNKTYVFSCWVKLPATNINDTIQFAVFGNSEIHLSSPVSVSKDEHWYRISETVTVSPTDVDTDHFFSFDFTGGNTVNPDDYIYVWGLQVEDADFSTSYIPQNPEFISRGTSASYFDENGHLIFVAADVERNNAHVFSDEGWTPIGKPLLEPERTNLMDESTGESWFLPFVGTTKTQLDLGVFNYFDGYEIASGGATDAVAATNVGTLSTANAYACTIYYREGTSEIFRVVLHETGAERESVVEGTVDNPVVVEENAGVIANLKTEYIDSDDCWKLTFVFYPDFNEQHNVRMGPVSTTAGENVILIGGQFEQGTYPTSYINTVGLPVTREEDIVHEIETTYTRNSTATYFDENGILQTAAIDEVRDDAYEYVEGSGWESIPLLIEPERTNIIRDSTGDPNYWDDSSTDSPTTILNLNVFGVLPGAEIYNGSTTPEFGTIFTTIDGTMTNGTDYAITVYAREGTSGNVFVSIFDNQVALESSIAGPISNPAVVDYVNDAGDITNLNSKYIAEEDCYEITFIFTPNNTPSSHLFYVGPYSTVIGETLIFLAGQIEEGNAPTSYIPTSGAAVTRAEDIVTDNEVPLDFSSRSSDNAFVDVLDIWFNELEGTFLNEYEVIGSGNSLNNSFVVFSSASNRLGAVHGDGIIRVFTGTSFQDITFASSVGDIVRLGITYTGQDWTLIVNGEVLGSGTGDYDSALFNQYSISSDGDSHVPSQNRDRKYLTRALTNDEMKVVTSF